MVVLGVVIGILDVWDPVYLGSKIGDTWFYTAKVYEAFAQQTLPGLPTIAPFSISPFGSHVSILGLANGSSADCDTCAAHHYQLVVPGEATVRIGVRPNPVTSDVFDTYLVLFDGQNREIARNDNEYTGTTNAGISRITLDEGVYTIEATNAQPNQGGQYELDVDGYSAVPDTPKIVLKPGESTNLVLNQNSCPRLECSPCYAQFAGLQLDQPAKITITLTAGGFSPYLALFDDLQTEHTIHELGVGTSTLTLDLASGFYLIEASSYSPGESGSALLSISPPQ